MGQGVAPGVAAGLLRHTCRMCCNYMLARSVLRCALACRVANTGAVISAVHACRRVRWPKPARPLTRTQAYTGVVLSVFFSGYATTQILGGKLADQFGGKMVLAAGVACECVG